MRWRTAACASRSAHSFSKPSASSQIPSQPSHSNSVAEPTSTRASVFRQAGQAPAGSPPARRSRRAPQCGQYAAPSNNSPKHEGQLTVASRARQYGHRPSAAAAGAPQLGQCRLPALWAMAQFRIRY